jgi:hypothetical protein
VFPPGYHCDPKQPLPFAGLASQKNHMSLYLMCAYGDSPLAEWFREAWAKTGKKLDMGKACVRLKKSRIWRSTWSARRFGAREQVSQAVRAAMRATRSRTAKGSPGKTTAGKANRPGLRAKVTPK